MPFIPHTDDDIKEMLETIKVNSIDELFDEIPEELTKADLSAVPDGCNEMEISRLMQERSPKLRQGRCFIGAGAYEHYIPAAVWQLATRGEFYTAYTPYQAEVSQGTLQLIYEYQTMMAELMAMDVSNASMYDGSTALAEACSMAIRLKKAAATKRILVPESVHPAYQKVLKTLLSPQEVTLVSVPIDKNSGTVDIKQFDTLDCDALIIPQPNFFGCLEAVDELTDWAHQQKLFVIGVVNPIAMSLLKPPGKWGAEGADIVCGEGQPLGVPLAYGGPYFGFMCTKKAHVRQIPGRIVGRTHDEQGREGYTLTLQAREQHIRRSKATSNICTNQGLLVTAASIYLSLLGTKGLYETALKCHQNANKLQQQLSTIPGVKLQFSSPCWHEFAITLPIAAETVIDAMSQQDIAAGYAPGKDNPDYPNTLLVCVTETKTDKDIENYVKQMKAVLEAQS